MRFNPQNSTCFSKRPIFDAVDSARSVEVMSSTTELARSFGRRGTLKKRAFFTQPSRAHFCARFSRRLFPQLALPNFFTNFYSSLVFSGDRARFFVPIAKMFVISKALKVFQPIVGLVFVNVMNVAARYVLFAPSHHNHSMNKIVPAAKVAVWPTARRKWLELSENFPASGYGVVRVNHTVINSVKSNREHVFS
jgi:hypothetical protein